MYKYVVRIVVKLLQFTIRAPAADVLNVPNVKFLAHLAHQTQK